MNHSKTSEPVRTIKVKNHLEKTFTTRQLKNSLDNYLFSHQHSGSISADALDLKEIISSFADLIKNSVKEGTIPLPQSTIEEQLNFYRQREDEYRAREEKLNSEVVLLMRSLSQKEEQIITKENEIFEYKMKVQQKEKQLLQLITNNVKEGNSKPLTIRVNTISKSSASRSKEFDKEQSVIPFDSQINQVSANQGILPLNTHKNTNQSTPLRTEPPSLFPLKQESILSPLNKSKFEPAEWYKERQRLLRLLRQKDQRIYELIQELSDLK